MESYRKFKKVSPVGDQCLFIFIYFVFSSSSHLRSTIVVIKVIVMLLNDKMQYNNSKMSVSVVLEAQQYRDHPQQKCRNRKTNLGRRTGSPHQYGYFLCRLLLCSYCHKQSILLLLILKNVRGFFQFVSQSTVTKIVYVGPTVRLPLHLHFY